MPNLVKNLPPRMVVAWMLIMMLPMAAFGQQTANQEASAQNARTYNDRGLAKEKKGDLDGANGRLQSGHEAKSEICCSIQQPGKCQEKERRSERSNG